MKLYLSNSNFRQLLFPLIEQVEINLRCRIANYFCIAYGVKNFLNNYENGSIPFYALVEILSFGTLSKFYKNMKNPDKKQVASAYGVGYTYFESWVESIAYVQSVT